MPITAFRRPFASSTAFCAVCLRAQPKDVVENLDKKPSYRWEKPTLYRLLLKLSLRFSITEQKRFVKEYPTEYFLSLLFPFLFLFFPYRCKKHLPLITLNDHYVLCLANRAVFFTLPRSTSNTLSVLYSQIKVSKLQFRRRADRQQRKITL